ncbi:MAG: gliding motility-associated C-terminal domain-containing protein [Crocinitomicaceae bacterium]
MAWQNDNACADTAYATVNVYDSLIVHVPNVFTPNNDGVNDSFGINTNLPIHAQLNILNRWGEVVYNFQGNLTPGFNPLWSTPADGVYFMVIFTLDDAITNCQLQIAK